LCSYTHKHFSARYIQNLHRGQRLCFASVFAKKTPPAHSGNLSDIALKTQPPSAFPPVTASACTQPIMDEKLGKILASPDFDAWRSALWKEISAEAIAHGWVSRSDIIADGTVDPESTRWSGLFLRLVEIRYLFRYPVSRSVHARFLHEVPKTLKRVDVGYLSFHTSPNPTPDDKALFEVRRKELLDWREAGGCPPKTVPKRPPKRNPKAH